MTYAVSTLLAIIQKYAFVPGHVENWVLIIDTNNIGIFDFPFAVCNIYFILILLGSEINY